MLRDEGGEDVNVARGRQRAYQQAEVVKERRATLATSMAETSGPDPSLPPSRWGATGGEFE
eukprot:123170-Hanusia_phi.AAC.1